MKILIGTSITLACTLLLAGCSSQTTMRETVAAGDAGAYRGQAAPAPAAPPPPSPSMLSSPGVAAYATSQRAIIAHSPWLAVPPSADKFPDKEAGKAILAADQPVSTFSVDVDTASYAFVRRMLSTGRMPPLAAVRVEEMVNYFPYRYAAPTSSRAPFAVSTEVMPSPWKDGNQLVHIAVRGYDIQHGTNRKAGRPRANVVLLVDVSGSMMPQDRLPLLKQGFHLLAGKLRDDDRIAIVTYANGTAVALEPTPGRERRKILDAIDGLHAGGGTAGGEGLQRAYALAERNVDREAVNRVVLATDGDFNLGITDPRQLEQFVAGKRKSGVYLSILGVGEGNLNDALMQRLAQSGNGNAAYIDTLMEANKVLGEELGSTMFPIANDVKVQVEFNPDRVAAYRLIGYETRMLQRQDFKDDKVDAGDMGAGHTATAIYEITPGDAAGTLVDPLRYGKKTPKTAAKGDELCFVKLRYKLPGEADSRLVEHPVRAGSARARFEAAPDDQRFAVAVAAFGQRLRGEAPLADTSYEQIAAMANAARGDDPEGYRAEFVKLVRMADALGKVAQAGPP